MAVKLKTIASMLLLAPALWGCNGHDSNDEPATILSSSQVKPNEEVTPPAANNNGTNEMTPPPVTGDAGTNTPPVLPPPAAGDVGENGAQTDDGTTGENTTPTPSTPSTSAPKGNDTPPAAPPATNNSVSNSNSTATTTLASGLDFFASGAYIYGLNRSNGNTSAVIVDQLGTTANANINAGYAQNFKNYHWLFNTANFNIVGANNIQTGALLYVNGQRFKKLQANAAAPVGASLVSSENQADRLCEATQPLTMRSSLSNAEVKYQLPGSDGICNSADDIYRRIKLNMLATDAPQTISATEFAALDVVDQSDQVKWRLAKNGGKVIRYNAAMGNPATLWDGQTQGWSKITALELSLVSISADGANDVLQLEVSGTKNGVANKEQILYVLNNGSGLLSAPIYLASLNKPAGKLFASGFELIGNQGGQQYFSVNDSDVIRFPDAGGTASVVASGVADVVGMTQTHLLFTRVSGNTVTLKAQDLSSAAAAATLKTATGLGGYTVSRDRVFFHLTSGSPAQSYNAGSIKLDGSGEVVFNNAKWVGYGVNNNVRTATALPNASSLLLAQNVSLDSNGNWSGGTLAAVSASSGQIVSNLGAAPAQVSRYSFVSVDYSGALLGYGYSSDGKLQYLLSANPAGQVVKVATDLSRIGWLTDWISGR